MDTTAYVQQNIWLHCKASGDPKPKVLWGKDIRGGDRLDSKRFIQHPNGTLQIKEVRLEDQGRYFCIAANHAEMRQVKFNLDVERKLNFSHVISCIGVFVYGRVYNVAKGIDNLKKFLAFVRLNSRVN